MWLPLRPSPSDRQYAVFAGGNGVDGCGESISSRPGIVSGGWESERGQAGGIRRPARVLIPIACIRYVESNSLGGH